MDLQYISDTDGRQTAVIIPIQDWHDLTAKHEDLRDLEKIEPIPERKKPSHYRGCISPELANELHEYTQKARKEWDRDIS